MERLTDSSSFREVEPLAGGGAGHQAVLPVYVADPAEISWPRLRRGQETDGMV